MRYQLSTLGVVTAVGMAIAPVAPAQTVSGAAYGAVVSTPLASSGKLASAVLDPAAGMNEASLDVMNVAGALSSKLATAVTTGAVGTGRSTAQSVATVADVSLLNGLVRASRVIGIAATTSDGATTSSNAYGSAFEGLVVGGTTVVGDGAVAPNTRMNLPGVGYVLLNEQIRSASGITVNMIHVVLTNALGAKTGEIIVGSARSGVS
jgi:hypothetical protein